MNALAAPGRASSLDGTSLGSPLCMFCGKPEQVEIFEVWGHEFMLDACCEHRHEQLVAELAEDPSWARRLLQHLDAETLCGHALRRVVDDSCTLMLDWQLEMRPIARNQARDFIARHHAHCRVPVTWRFHAAIFNGATLLGVAVVGNPVARALAGRGVVEVNRLCVRRDVGPALRWNAASMLYGWCAREAARQGWRRIVTYTRADEPGTSLRGAGWTPEARVRGRGWHGTRRARSNSNAWIDKIRWSKTLPSRQASAPAPKSKRPDVSALDAALFEPARAWTA